jgi:hypothetical protein
MAVTSTERPAPYGSGTATPKKFLDGTYAVSFQKDFNVFLDATAYAADVAIRAAVIAGAIPGPGADWPADPRYVVARITMAHQTTRDEKTWIATLFVEPDPTLLMPEVQFQTTRYSEVVDVDKNGEAILNKAGRPFAKGIEETFGRTRLEVTRCFAPETFDPAILDEAIHRRSSNYVVFNWLGRTYSYYAGELYCSDLQAPFLWDPMPHFRVTGKFDVDRVRATPYGIRGGWIHRPLNMGKECLDDAGKLVPCKIKGIPTGDPQPLDNNGKQLAQGQKPSTIIADTKLQFDFSTLHLFPDT